MAVEKKLATPPSRGAGKGETKSEVAAREQVDRRKLEAERRQARTYAKQQQIAERIATATDELSSSVQEASSACEELKSAMDQIASGAQQAGGASEESLAAITQILGNVRNAAEAAKLSLEKGIAIQDLVRVSSGEIEGMIQGVNAAADKNAESARLVGELEKMAENIGGIVSTVVNIADQTNLLALNAAIEAARAGEHGKGFAVVADEVRTLAETSEKAANDIRDLVGIIQNEVRSIAEEINKAAETARQEVEKGKTVTADLVVIARDMAGVVDGSREIEKLSQESTVAAESFREGSAQIARTAQEQAQAAQEVLASVEQQTEALEQISTSAAELAEMADVLRSSTDVQKSAEGLAAAAEELSAAIEEMNRSAQQIMSALDQVSQGAEQQAKAAENSATAAGQTITPPPAAPTEDENTRRVNLMYFQGSLKREPMSSWRRRTPPWSGSRSCRTSSPAISRTSTS